MEDTIIRVLDGPTSELAQALDDQADLIEDKMEEQIDIIVGPDKTREEVIADGGMIGMVDAALQSFSEDATEAVEQLQAGADQAVAAGKELEATAKKYSWSASVSPFSVLSGEFATVTLTGQPSKGPLLTIRNIDGEVIIQEWVMAELTPGVYKYEFNADTRFPVGRAYFYSIYELTTGGIIEGSGMVEEMSLSTVAGMVASETGTRSVAQSALDAIEDVKAAIISEDSVSIIESLQGLQESIEDIPAELAALDDEGPSGLSDELNGISEQLEFLAEEFGIKDIEQIIEEQLADSPTLKAVRKKTDGISQIVDILLEILNQRLGGLDTPIVSMYLTD